MLRELSTNSSFNFDFSKSKIAIVQSSYHSDITEELKNGALHVLHQHKIKEIFHIEMPGAYELVFGCNKAFELIDKLDGVIALGCVIKGDTDHDVYINHAVAHGLIDLENKFRVPIGFGLLTTNNHQQALDRAGGIHGNKGAETALAVLHSLSFKVHKI
jgi:6,7-dimethyl-8-ribityllumazine synthase